MKVKLNIKDRLSMGALYPMKGDLKTNIIINDIEKKVRLTQEEMIEIELKKIENSYVWNVEKAKDKEIELTEIELQTLKEQITKLDNEKRIPREITELCQKIQDLKEKENGN